MTKRFFKSLLVVVFFHLVAGATVYVFYLFAKAENQYYPSQNPSLSPDLSPLTALSESKDVSKSKPSIQQPPTQEAARSDKIASQDAKVITHTVVPGESFWTISKKYNVPMRNILVYNQLSNDYILKPGEKIKIPIQDTNP